MYVDLHLNAKKCDGLFNAISMQMLPRQLENCYVEYKVAITISISLLLVSFQLFSFREMKNETNKKIIHKQHEKKKRNKNEFVSLNNLT